MKKFLLCFFQALVLFGVFNSYSQVPPDTQKEGIYAATSVKVDGHSSDWNEARMALNKSTALSYSIKNNDTDLFLLIRADKQQTIGKLLRGGLTLTIRNSNSDKGTTMSINYPMRSTSDRSRLVNRLDTTKTMSSTTVLEINTQLESTSKELKIMGSPLIQDSLVSIYNEYGVKVFQRIDEEKVYTLEMSIPIKYVKPYLGSDDKFSYTIRLDGLSVNRLSVTRPTENGTRERTEISSAQSVEMLTKMGASGLQLLDLINPTSLSEQYTLVKK